MLNPYRINEHTGLERIALLHSTKIWVQRSTKNHRPFQKPSTRPRCI